MKRDKIYISGPISSRPLVVAINHFMMAEVKLQAQGYRTCNPLNMRLCVWLAKHGHYRLCLLLQLLWMWWTCSCIYLLTDWHTSDGARLERSFARCLGLTVLYEKQRRAPSNIPAPTHVLTPEKKTSKKHKKDKGDMTIAEIYIGLVAGAKYRRKSWSGTKYIFTDWEKFDRPIVAIHSKDGHEGVYAFNNCDFFANDWEEVQP